MNVKATCANCKCNGKLFKRKKRRVILVPTDEVDFEVQDEDSKRYEKGFLAPHGFATALQMISFVSLGTLFWVTVMLIANFISLENNKFKPGVGSYCVLEYKKCISEFDWNLCASSMYDCGDMENENYGSFIFTAPQKDQTPSNTEQSLVVFSNSQNKANENLCLFTAHVSNNICENLCFSSDFSYDPDENEDLIYNHQKDAECKSICISASDLEIEEDCPLRKRCPNGCPCPGYKCLEDVLDFDLAGVYFGRNDFRNSSMSFYKISLQQHFVSVKFDALTMPAIDNYCIVPFQGDYFIIQASLLDNKLTLHKIHKNGVIEKLSEDFAKVQIIFGGTTSGTSNKICRRGIYDNKEERIIFCSTNESRGICHSYAIKENNVFLTEIYNRPESTINPLLKNNGVFGLTFNNMLVCVNKKK